MISKTPRNTKKVLKDEFTGDSVEVTGPIDPVKRTHIRQPRKHRPPANIPRDSGGKFAKRPPPMAPEPEPDLEAERQAKLERKLGEERKAAADAKVAADAAAKAKADAKAAENAAAKERQVEKARRRVEEGARRRQNQELERIAYEKIRSKEEAKAARARRKVAKLEAKNARARRKAEAREARPVKPAREWRDWPRILIGCVVVLGVAVLVGLFVFFVFHEATDRFGAQASASETVGDTTPIVTPTTPTATATPNPTPSATATPAPTPTPTTSPAVEPTPTPAPTNNTTVPSPTNNTTAPPPTNNTTSPPPATEDVIEVLGPRMIRVTLGSSGNWSVEIDTGEVDAMIYSFNGVNKTALNDTVKVMFHEGPQGKANGSDNPEGYWNEQYSPLKFRGPEGTVIVITW